MNKIFRVLFFSAIVYFISRTMFKKDSQDETKRDLRELISRYSLVAYGVICGIVIIILIILAWDFSSQGRISESSSWGFSCSSIGTAIAFYVALFKLSRHWLIWAFMLFVFGLFFQLFTLLPNP